MAKEDVLADDIIKTHVVISLGAALVPVPLLDLVAVTAVQLDMLRQLCKNYDIEFKEEIGKSLISSIAGTALARYGASLIKTIPGIGSILGGISLSVLSGASTYALGQVFKKHFGEGGDFFNIDLEKAKKIFEVEIEKGKKVAKDLEKEDDVKKTQATVETDTDDDIFDKIRKLGELKKEGVISEEEFNEQKKKLLDQI